MIQGLAILLGFQLAGESLARLTGLPVPGPVLGLAFFFLFGLRWPRVFEIAGPVARQILAVLSLLFVPAGMGVVGHLGLLTDHGLAIAVVLVISTVVALVATAATFILVERWVSG